MSATALLSGFGRYSAATAKSFNLNYAPHFGMFSHAAPGGLLDELDFMAEQGFRSLEDNEMKKRPVARQKQIAAAMEK